MPKVTDQYREARRDEITAAAMRAFHRKGFQNASMADIITESGLSAGAIYGHFKSKSEIVFAVSERVAGARALEVADLAAREPMPPPAALIRVIMEGMLTDIGRPAMLVQLWGEAVTDPAIRELAVRVMNRLRSVYSDYISLWHQRQHGLSPADAEAMGARQLPLFLSAAQGYIVQSALLDDFDREHYLTTIEQYLPR